MRILVVLLAATLVGCVAYRYDIDVEPNKPGADGVEQAKPECSGLGGGLAVATIEIKLPDACGKGGSLRADAFGFSQVFGGIIGTLGDVVLRFFGHSLPAPEPSTP